MVINRQPVIKRVVESKDILRIIARIPDGEVPRRFPLRASWPTPTTTRFYETRSSDVSRAVSCFQSTAAAQISRLVSLDVEIGRAHV